MKRTYRPLFPGILDVQVDQFALEFANREMSELALWSQYGDEREVCGWSD